LSGAHYGLAFLLLKRGDAMNAEHHLERFLAQPPAGTESERWIRHAEQALEALRQHGEVEVTDPDASAEDRES